MDVKHWWAHSHEFATCTRPVTSNPLDDTEYADLQCLIDPLSLTGRKELSSHCSLCGEDVVRSFSLNFFVLFDSHLILKSLQYLSFELLILSEAWSLTNRWNLCLFACNKGPKILFPFFYCHWSISDACLHVAEIIKLYWRCRIS